MTEQTANTDNIIDEVLNDKAVLQPDGEEDIILNDSKGFLDEVFNEQKKPEASKIETNQLKDIKKAVHEKADFVKYKPFKISGKRELEQMLKDGEELDKTGALDMHNNAMNAYEEFKKNATHIHMEFDGEPQTRKIKKNDANFKKLNKMAVKEFESKFQINNAVKSENMAYKILWLKRVGHNERFGDYLKDEMKLNFDMDELNEMNEKELDDMCEKVKVYIANRTSKNVIKDVVKTGLPVAEGLLDKFYKCKGFSNILSQDQDFLDSLEEYSLTSELNMYITPRNRMLLHAVKAIYIAHELHEQLAPMKEMKSKEEKEQFLEKLTGTKIDDKKDTAKIEETKLNNTQSSDKTLMPNNFMKEFNDLL